MEGFLGTGATVGADVNLLAQVTMALALGGGAWLARRKYYFAHGCVQASVVGANLFFIFWVMLQSFSRQVAPQVPAGLSDRYYLVAFAHAVAGAAAELLGIYVVLSATKIVPAALRFENYRPWMRTTLVLGGSPQHWDSRRTPSGTSRQPVARSIRCAKRGWR
jgi:uncharacterized membrane protein YozB (DUF420 family)